MVFGFAVLIVCVRNQMRRMTTGMNQVTSKKSEVLDSLEADVDAWLTLRFGVKRMFQFLDKIRGL